jgi:RNA polymerase sigma-70 factor (ECF subfamily)
VWWQPLQDEARARSQALPAELEPRLEELWRTGLLAWKLEVPRDDFAAHLTARWPAELPLADWLSRAAVSDLYLACGCLSGNAAAISAFDRRYIDEVRRYLRTLSLSPAQLDDLKQLLREKLLARGSRLADYSGRGSLEGWFRVLAVREAIDLVNHREERRPILASPPDRADSRDLGDELLKTRYRAAFNAALRQAIDTLDAEQRNLLRLHYLEGLTLDELASFFAVHRATVARRMSEARDAVSGGMAERLRAALGVGESELASLLTVLGSQLEVSISACFAADGAA